MFTLVPVFVTSTPSGKPCRTFSQSPTAGPSCSNILLRPRAKKEEVRQGGVARKETDTPTAVVHIFIANINDLNIRYHLEIFNVPHAEYRSVEPVSSGR